MYKVAVNNIAFGKAKEWAHKEGHFGEIEARQEQVREFAIEGLACTVSKWVVEFEDERDFVHYLLINPHAEILCS